MNLLLIETATAVCSVALAGGDGILAELHTDQPNAHSSQLSPLIGRLYAMCGITARQLDAVCVSSGPGSYTGLRIAEHGFPVLRPTSGIRRHGLSYD